VFGGGNGVDCGCFRVSTVLNQGSEKPMFLKIPTHRVFLVFIGFGLYLVFGFFCLNEQLLSLFLI